MAHHTSVSAQPSRTTPLLQPPSAPPSAPYTIRQPYCTCTLISPLPFRIPASEPHPLPRHSRRLAFHPSFRTCHTLTAPLNKPANLPSPSSLVPPALAPSHLPHFANTHSHSSRPRLRVPTVQRLLAVYHSSCRPTHFHFPTFSHVLLQCLTKCSEVSFPLGSVPGPDQRRQSFRTLFRIVGRY